MTAAAPTQTSIQADEALEAWFKLRGWSPFDFQRDVWSASTNGRSGLLHAPTGTGKTLAAIGGPLRNALAAPARRPDDPAPITVLWITPLRALARDTVTSILEPVQDLDVPWTVELRTGDTSAAIKARQRRRLPSVLITTPESLTVFLSYPEWRARLRTLQACVVDEWHELLASKRGVQTELALARLRCELPSLRTWGMSATIANVDEAMSVLLGPAAADDGLLVRGTLDKRIDVHTIRPDDAERFPWSGHLGTRLRDAVIEAVEQHRTTLLFTNTRSQTELWFQSILRARPDLIGEIAVHHGSLDRGLRAEVETLLRAGRLKCVVCTSSLDLGVDFAPVEQVIQIGSPKGVARMLQRAGRSGHQPGAVSRVIGVPTNALELVEFSAARIAVQARRVEARAPLRQPLDVLVQHLVTVAMGGGFDEAQLREEVRSTFAYSDLTDAQWAWAMEFVRQGGPTLTAYPQFARVRPEDDRFVGPEQRIARQHRMTIGTISSSTSMKVKFVRGKTLGFIEESFIGRLKNGDRFVFSGRTVELVRVRDMTAHVRLSRRKSGTVPRWGGGRSPLSSQLAEGVRARLDDARRGVFDDDEMRLVQPLLELQARWSVIPARDEVLIESVSHRGRHHVFVFTLAGRLVNEGLATLIAHRVTERESISLSASANDYGFELTAGRALPDTEDQWRALLSAENLLEDLLRCLNASQLARRRFRDIARVAGLVFSGFPGQPKATRHLQASSDLFFDVFTEFDPDNLLLSQARQEVLESELEFQRLRDTLTRIASERLVLRTPAQLTPLAFPLWADEMRTQQLSSERWIDRVHRMVEQLERAAAEP